MRSLFFAIVLAGLAATTSWASSLGGMNCKDKESGQTVVAITKKGNSFTYSKIQSELGGQGVKQVYKEVPGLTLNECYQDGEGEFLISCRGKMSGTVIKLKTYVKVENSLEVERDANDVATGVVSRKAEKSEIEFEVKKLAGSNGGENDWEKMESLKSELKLKKIECTIN